MVVYIRVKEVGRKEQQRKDPIQLNVKDDRLCCKNSFANYDDDYRVINMIINVQRIGFFDCLQDSTHIETGHS